MKKQQKPVSAESALSAEELSLLKKSVDADRASRKNLAPFDNSDGAKLVRYAKKNRVFTAVVAALIALCIIALTLGGIFLYKYTSGLENKDDFTVIIGDETYTMPYKSVVFEGDVYVDMYKIAEYASLAISGSSTKIKFTSDDNNYLKFENDSREAIINGSLVDLGGSAQVSQGKCLVPIKFLQKAVGNGLRISLDRKTNTIEVKRRMYSTDKKDVFVPVEILFYTDAFTVLIGITQIDQSYNYQYSINVDAYLPYIDPTNSNDYLILANKQNALTANYAPNDLKKITSNTQGKQIELRACAERALYALMLEMEAQGITNIFVTSGYRDYAYQEWLFDKYVIDEMGTISDNAIRYFGRDYINQNYLAAGLSALTEQDAIAVVKSYSAEAGTSEHQTGLCIDFMKIGDTELNESFENTAAFRWLSQNAYKYGFILRYPKDKTDLTGYKYEPWHYRFVGREAATEMYLSGLTLEEYLDLN